MSILNKIASYKKEEVEKNKSLFPIKLLEDSIYYNSQCLSLKEYISKPDKSGIISEIKRKSPSQSEINLHVDIEQTSLGYMQAGSSALSILTDNHFFGGSNSDLTTARQYNFCPILRKDFIIDPYQIIEAKSIGADAILLIASILDKNRCLELAKMAKSLNLEVLFEVHNEEELELLNDYIDIVGVNNRNLRTFEIDIDTSRLLINIIPDQFLKISESGISSPQTCKELRDIGYDGFLIGSHFMQQGQPHLACGEFIEQLNKL